MFFLKTLNVSKITQEARFNWKRFLNIYKIDKEMMVMVEKFFKRLINSNTKNV